MILSITADLLFMILLCTNFERYSQHHVLQAGVGPAVYDIALY